MKQLIFLLCTFALFACNDDDSGSETIPNPVLPASDLFKLDEVPEIELQFSLAQWNLLLTNYDLNPKNEKKVISRFTYKVNGVTTVLDSIGLKLRGNTSRRRPEGNEGELHNATSPDWHHCHFGLDFAQKRPDQRFKGLAKMNLKWFKDDADYVREIYSYDLFHRFGVWTAPRASYCRVTVKIDGDTTPAYHGVYAMLESVDEEFIAYRGSFWTPTPGFMWKGGYAGSFVPDFVSTNSMGVEDVKLNPALSLYYAYDLKTRKDELDAGKSQLTAFINDLNTKTGDEFQTWISQTMDVDLFLKTYAVNVMVGMWDDYWVNTNNFYFYFANNGKAYFIPYDYDNTLGTSELIGNSGTQDPLNWGPASGRPLVTKILGVTAYRDKYKTYIKQLADSNNDLFDPTKSMQRITAWQTMIAPYISNATGEDMVINDHPANWGNAGFYRLLSGNNEGGANGNANYFSSRIHSLPW
ncbi:MAG TPA: CotH kinase family protein [Flavobacterium sp.]|nr:CotH kinase family protein [Flavobacterium sp.]